MKVTTQSGCTFTSDTTYITKNYRQNTSEIPPPEIRAGNTKEETNVLIYPNPANDFINVKITDAVSGEIKIHITDLQGRILYSFRELISAGSYNRIYSTSDLAPRSYLVEVMLNEISTNHSFSINR